MPATLKEIVVWHLLSGWYERTNRNVVKVVNRICNITLARIVSTPNDLGRMGQLLTHPELLDWLALEFRDQGQSFKIYID